MLTNWTPDSWRKFPIVQVPDYADAGKLKAVEAQLAGFPPLVFAGEARKLKRKLARVAGPRRLKTTEEEASPQPRPPPRRRSRSTAFRAQSTRPNAVTNGRRIGRGRMETSPPSIANGFTSENIL